ncbi:MAG: hypothetical protein J6Z49_07485 [Kiritimatiellae bacterium]|nr:hypothetical protein [Kiritimatiellia bacterium]
MHAEPARESDGADPLPPERGKAKDKVDAEARRDIDASETDPARRRP